MDVSALTSSDSESEEEFFALLDAACYIPAVPKKRIVRDRVDFFTKYDDYEFERRFRLTKEMARQVADLLRDKLSHDSDRNDPVSVETQVLITMRYFGSASFEEVIADLQGIHQTTAGRIVKRVSHAIAALADQVITMPAEQEIQGINQQFFQMGKIPRVIGVIDGCHVPIISPGGDNAEAFRNRKGWFSINVMAVCDAEMRFRNIVAR
ncbi:uncharacterized protein LOC115256994 [Aedes albopictus]|uniref:Nuclease HARBI1 n=1 Tax=Aedes albopictus TaxID=7160 RepID=A0ABM1YBH2_AEDAL